MKHILVVLLLLAAIPANASDVYNVEPEISERELCQLYADVLLKFSRFAETTWKQSPDDPKAGYWGNGISGGNEGIRAVGNTALVYAVLAKETDALDSATRRAYINRALAGVRYAAMSHITNTGKCIDGKQWGRSWQSAMWAANMGFAAWILRDDSDPELMSSVERVIAFEADRFLNGKPGANRRRDTKAEENGWDQILISLAPNMLPDHPNAAKWREKSIEWMMNVISAPQDATDMTVIDGRPVKDWFVGANTHPDFTLENHGFFHPSYTMVSPAEVGQGALFYAYAAQPIPQAAGHHLLDNWWAMQEFMQPSGEWIFPQGMDWELHSDSHIHYLAWLAIYGRDPVAAMMEKRVAQNMREQQRIYGTGRLAGPASSLGYARDCIQTERTAYALLYHKYIGPPADDPVAAQRTWRSLNGVRRHFNSDFITHRTGSKFASFSWKNQIMGEIVPMSADHAGNPHFTTPITSGFVGSFAIADPNAKGLKVIERTWRMLADGFETRGTLSINGGLLKQEIVFISVGEKAVVYLDRVTAVKDVRIEQEIGVPFGIENDELNGDRQTLYYEGGSQVVTGPDTDQTIRIPGKWANVDGRLGVIAPNGGLVYRDMPRYNRNGAREDFLYGSFSAEPRECKAGDVVAQRALLFLTETSAEETAAFASKVRLDGTRLSVELPEGSYAFDL